MWCDNCLLIFPLRHGALALAGFMAAYSLAGAITLFLFGDYFWFLFPEAQIYGGISIGVMVLCITSAVGISNNTTLWLRFSFFLWPVIIIATAVRAGIMLFRLDYYQGHVIWECNHGGIKWNATIEAQLANNTVSLDQAKHDADKTMPGTFCNTGFHNLYIAFAFALVVDWVMQLYMYFLEWRCLQRVYHYIGFKRTSMQEAYGY